MSSHSNDDRDYVVGAAWSPDGRRLLSGGGGKDRSVRLWDADSAKQLHSYLGHREDVEAVAFHPAANRIISGSEDRTLKVWDTESEKELLTIVPFADGEYLAYTPNGCYTGSAGVDKHFKTLVGGVEKAMTPEIKKGIFNPDGFAAVVAGARK
jgi:WD40 repeat protein